MTIESASTEFSFKISKADVQDMLIRKASGQPINPADVYIAPELTSMSVGFMMDANTVAARMAPSVPVPKQKGSYPVFPRSYWFRDEMQERADAQAAAEGTLGLTFDNYAASVYAWRVALGSQARANALPVDLDQAGVRLATNKALLKREILWFNKFFKTGVWTTQLQLKTSGGGGVAGTDLSFKDATALPVKQIKAQLDAQAALTGGLYRCNRAVWARDAWTAFCEHPNVLSRINAGQTPGGPADVTTQMVAGWLGLDEVIVADGIQTTSAEGLAEASATYSRIATSGQILFAYVPPKPALFTPSAMYSFDWVPPDSMVGGYGNAVSSYFLQERKAMMYEIEMATDQHVVSADCGVLLYNCLA